MRGITPIAGKRGTGLLPALLALGLACPAAAVDSPPVPPAEQMLTLARLLDLAAASHPDLGIARARVEAARGRMVQAGLRLNPVVSIGDEEINNPAGRAGRPYINFSQEIITAHKRELARAAAAQGVVAADWQAVTRWYDITVRVRHLRGPVSRADRYTRSNHA